MTNYLRTKTSTAPLAKLLGVIASATIVLALSEPAYADVVSDREEGFKASKRSISSIKDAIASGDTGKVASAANSIAAFAERIPSLFPPGSKGGFFSAAKDEIWPNFHDFAEKAKHLQTESRLLSELARTGTTDKASLSSALTKVSETCHACHQTYKRGR